MADLWTMFRKEWREMQHSRSGLAGRVASVLLPLAVMGVLLPWQIGAAWVETPVGIGFWCWVSLLMVTPYAADSIAGERERHTLETLLAGPLSDSSIVLGKALATLLYGWIMGTAASLLALVTVNLAHADGTLRLYPPSVFSCGLILSALTAGLGAIAGLLISLRAPTVRQAQQALSIVVLLLALGPILGAWLAPASMWIGVIRAGESRVPLLATSAIALALLDLALLLLALRRFQRHRLLLD